MDLNQFTSFLIAKSCLNKEQETTKNLFDFQGGGYRQEGRQKFQYERPLR